MTPAEYTAWKLSHAKPHAPCRVCKKTDVQFGRYDTRCRNCACEAARRSRIKTGKRKATMVGE